MKKHILTFMLFFCCNILFASNTIEKPLLGYPDSVTVITSNYSEKFVYTYLDGRIVSKISFYQRKGGKWELQEKMEQGFDSDGRTILLSKLWWSNDTGTWVDGTKKEWEYDDKGNLLYNADFYWRDGKWSGSFMLKNRYIYDKDGKSISTETDLSADGGQTWNTVSKSEYAYDDNGRIIFSNSTEWNSKQQQWVWNYKNVYAYGIHGMTKLENYNWNSSSNNWEGFRKDDYFYNDNGSKKEYITYKWDADGKQWKYWRNYQYTYGENEEVETGALWDDSIQDWDINYKTKSGFDNRKNVLLQQTEIKESDKWIGNSKIEWVYDDHDNELLKSVYSWDKSLNDWRKSFKYETKYNENDSIILKCSYSAYPGYEWEMKKKEEYTFDENNNKIIEVLSSYNEFDYTIKEKSKTEYTFDSEGHKLKEVHFEKLSIGENSNWDFVNTKTYYYSNSTDVNTTFASEWALTCNGLEISVCSDFDSDIQVYSLDGRIVISGKSKVKVPSEGFYIIRVNGISQKVLVSD